MREILFRGKKKDSGEWVCGDLIQLHEEAPYWYILPEGISSEMYEDEPYHFRQNDVMCSVALAKVVPETIGQFTGLTDKNGKKIFEGDIVKIHRKYLNAGCEEDCLYEVIWHKSWYGWALRNLKPTQCCYLSNAVDSEIIGNIHDNKELLGENK